MVRRALASSQRALASLRQLRHLRPLSEREAQFFAQELGERLALSQLRIAGGGHPCRGVVGRAAYRYSVGSDPSEVLRTFLDGNIEQQGPMFEDYGRSNVCMKQARDATFEHMARYICERERPKTA